MLTNLLTPLSPVSSDSWKVHKTGHESPSAMHSDLKHPRIAYLVSRYPAVSHTFILNEVKRLRNQGFDIGVASVNPPDRAYEKMTQDELDEAASTYYVKAHGAKGALLAHIIGLKRPIAYFHGLAFAFALGGWNLKRALFGFFYFTEALMIAAWMKSNGFTHLHVHFATAAANIGLVLRKFHGCTLSFTVHGPDEFYDTRGQWLEEKISAVDFLICIGRFARSQIMKLSSGDQWGKFEICPLGVDPDYFMPHKLSKSNRPFTILCVGRLTPSKGQRVLLDACRMLHEEGRDFSLVMVGAGPDEEILKNAAREFGIADLVNFTGPLNHEQVQACYAEADVFALASFAEGIPVVLMEAMASGVPCVTTRITGIPELIRDGVDGLLVTPSDAVELSDTLAYLMDDPELRGELAREARQKVLAEYDLNKNITRLAQIFRNRLENISC